MKNYTNFMIFIHILYLLTLLIFFSITAKIWFIIVLTESILSHAGYKYFSEAHDKHHMRNNINYGNNLFMDRLFGTYG